MSGRPQPLATRICEQCGDDYQGKPPGRFCDSCKMARARSSHNLANQAKAAPKLCRRCEQVIPYGERRKKWCFACSEIVRKEQQKAELLERIPARFGISFSHYWQMLVAQDFKCGGCSVDYFTYLKRTGKKFAIDHDHTCCNGDFSCGRCIRGLLCHSCNLKIVGTDPVAGLKRLLGYLLDPHPRKMIPAMSIEDLIRMENGWL